ncbi:MAG: ATP-binding cassette domain-containing protein [Euzebyales bacterium]|nr:ATP-binding cassette domain-containing protein [Euzebyales bacterium]
MDREHHPAADGPRPLTDDPRAQADALIDRLDLTDLADRQAAAVSLGGRRRAALARALLTQPAVLLADESRGRWRRAPDGCDRSAAPNPALTAAPQPRETPWTPSVGTPAADP